MSIFKIEEEDSLIFNIKKDNERYDEIMRFLSMESCYIHEEEDSSSVIFTRMSTSEKKFCNDIIKLDGVKTISLKDFMKLYSSTLKD